jgi:hypothetical protein
MSDADKRKQRKAQKERQLAKKQGRLLLRQQELRGLALQRTMDTIREEVSAGQVLMAVTSLPDREILVVAIWEPTGVVAHSYEVANPAAMSAFTMEANRHGIETEELAIFLSGHAQAMSEAGTGEIPVSLMKWRPGEGPATVRPPTLE